MKTSKLRQLTGLNSAAQKNVLLFVLLNSLTYMTQAVINPYLTTYYYDAGMSNAEIGYLLAAGPLAAILIQPFLVSIVDKTGKSLAMLRFVILGSACAAPLYLLGGTFWWFLAATILYQAFNTSVIPLCDAEAFSYLSTVNIKYSRIRLGGTLGYSIAVVAVGAYLRSNPSMSFIINPVLLCLLFTLLFFLPKRPKSSRSPQEKKAGGGFSELFKVKPFMFIVVFIFVFQIGIVYCNNFLGVLIKEMGYTNAEIGVCMMLVALSEVPVLLYIDTLLRRFDRAKLMIIAIFILSLRIVLMFTAQSMAVIYISQLLQGPGYMVVLYSGVTYAGIKVNETLRRRAQGLLVISQIGLGSIMGSVGGGQLANLFGVRRGSMFIVLLMLAFGAAVLCAYLFSPRFRKAVE